MSDIFREVDEDLRREQFKKIWKRYGNYIIAVAVLIVVVVAGYRLWEYWQARQAEQSGDDFLAAIELAEAGEAAQAEAALNAVVTEGSGEYPALARMRAAALKANTGDTTGAVAGFDEVAGDASVPEPLRTVARIRAAMLLVDSASFGDIAERIGSLAGDDGPYRNAAREVLGLSAFRAGNYDGARGYFEAIAADPTAGGNVGTRTRLMLDLIRARQGEPAAAPAEGES